MSQIVANHVGMQYAVVGDSSSTKALTELNLTVKDNEFLCLVGPSGCGKSTFLNLIAGFIQPSEGELTVDGSPIVGPGPDRGVVFQEDALFPWLTALDNVAFGLVLRGTSRALANESAV